MAERHTESLDKNSGEFKHITKIAEYLQQLGEQIENLTVSLLSAAGARYGDTLYRSADTIVQAIMELVAKLKRRTEKLESPSAPPPQPRGPGGGPGGGSGGSGAAGPSGSMSQPILVD
jgi:hypothetical protein